MSGLASIVIPVFNGMPYLPAAVDSALAQTYAELEVVVIDNSSSDGTHAWLEGVRDPRLRVVRRDSTQSAARNWTQAIAESRGRFVKLLCADDLIEPDAVARQAQHLAATPRTVLAASRRRIIDNDGRVLKAAHGLEGLEGVVDGRDAIRRCMLAGTNLLGEPSAVLFDGDAVRAAMPWREDWPYMIDMATYAAVLRTGSAVCEKEVLASFRVSPSSWSSTLLDQQPMQFRGWRDAVADEGWVPFGRVDHARSEVALRVRTIARRAYFRRVANRSRADRE